MQCHRLGPEIRILGMIDRLKPIVQTHCQIWFKDDAYDPVIVPVQSYLYMWRRYWGHARHGTLQPYLFSCQVLFHFKFNQTTINRSIIICTMNTFI